MRYRVCRSWILGIFFFVVFQASGEPLILKFIQALSSKVYIICVHWRTAHSTTIDRLLNRELFTTTMAIKQALYHDNSLVDTADESGKTPLMAAAFAGFDSIVTLLLNYGARIDRVDKRGKSAIDYAYMALSPHDPFSRAIAQMQEPFYRWGTHRQCLQLIDTARFLEQF